MFSRYQGQYRIRYQTLRSLQLISWFVLFALTLSEVTLLVWMPWKAGHRACAGPGSETLPLRRGPPHYRVHQTTSPYDLSPSNRDSWAFSSRVSLLVALLVPLWRALCSKVKRACTFATGSDVAGPRRRHGRTTELVTIVSHQANTRRLGQSLRYSITPVVTSRIFSEKLISRKI